MPARRSVVGGGDVGAPAAAQPDALNAAQVGLHSGSGLAGQAGDGKRRHTALLQPLGGKGDLRAGLQGEPEGVAVPARGFGRVLHAQVLADGTGGAALKLGGKIVLRQPPDRQLCLVIPVGREEKVLVLRGRPRKYDAADVGLDGQGGVAGPIGQGEGRVCVIQHAQFLHGERFGAGEHLIEHAAQQRHLPAGAVHFQRLPAELRVCRRAGTLAGKGIAHGHHRAQQHGNAQNDTNDPQQKSFHGYVLLLQSRIPALGSPARGAGRAGAGNERLISNQCGV